MPQQNYFRQLKRSHLRTPLVHITIRLLLLQTVPTYMFMYGTLYWESFCENVILDINFINMFHRTITILILLRICVSVILGEGFIKTYYR